MFAWWSFFFFGYIYLLLCWGTFYFPDVSYICLVVTSLILLQNLFFLRIRNIHWGLMYSDIYYKCYGIWWTALRGCLETYPHHYYAFWQMLGALAERNCLSAQYWSGPWPRTRSILSEILWATTRSRPPWTGISWLDSKLWLFKNGIG